MSPQAVFTEQDGHFVASELARGPWDPDAEHGGAPAALLMRAFEQLPAPEGLLLARVTYEFMRPVPLGALRLQATIARPGRRVQLLEASLTDEDETEVVRARALRVRAADPSVPATPPMPAPPGPEHGQVRFLRAPHRPTFTPDAVEVRFVEGGFMEGGSAVAWFRLQVELVAGEAPSGLQRLAAAGDFGNGISSALSFEEYLFINPDLTLYVDREPVGEWIGLRSETRIAGGGIGISESVLYDEHGRVGRATQALFVARRAT